MTDTLKLADAEALRKATRRRFRWTISVADFEAILADITTDDLSPAHRDLVKREGQYAPKGHEDA